MTRRLPVLSYCVARVWMECRANFLATRSVADFVGILGIRARRQALAALAFLLGLILLPAAYPAVPHDGTGAPPTVHHAAFGHEIAILTARHVDSGLARQQPAPAFDLIEAAGVACPIPGGTTAALPREQDRRGCDDREVARERAPPA